MIWKKVLNSCMTKFDSLLTFVLHTIYMVVVPQLEIIPILTLLYTLLYIFTIVKRNTLTTKTKKQQQIQITNKPTKRCNFAWGRGTTATATRKTTTRKATTTT